ncbi:TPA: hypothetical protein ACGFBU_000629 [Clostridium perfringens]|uniref:hypothetical protein n=1 Tax=Clostridium perfringens TaxID=1502 RepID=UPI000D9FF983|nr:hypothetical protein [Clostridium perfringens]DAL45227.1 MAG TPA_asm: hypothetical protein [Caudoviricetes sp.]EGT0695716.1 hypothetical protein [Clostridium perfringens]EGT3603451.1 hypothetical protein [Clostridium perfringens]MDK0576461.1 hypothetical protein [Clostridium perfringens]MDK0579404.1 hypothetical protein [Clostridium perfringens]
MGLIYRMCKAFSKFFRSREVELKDEKHYVEKCIELEKAMPRDEVAATDCNLYADHREGIVICEIDKRVSRIVRVKTHKRHRIDKKWLKRYGYKRIFKQDPKVYKRGKVYYGSRKALDKFLYENQDRFFVLNSLNSGQLLGEVNHGR